METAFFSCAPHPTDELGAEGARLLTDPHVQRLLGPFFGPGLSVPEAARVLGLEPRALRYWVRQLVASGVLIECRDGTLRRSRVYRTAAPAYFVPFERVPHLTLEGLFERLEAVPLGVLHRNLLALAHGSIPGLHRWGLWLRPRAADGTLDVQVGPRSAEVSGLQAFLRDQDGPAVLMCWIPLTLEFEDAKAFQRELGALIERFQTKRGTQSYLARIAMTPLLKP